MVQNSFLTAEDQGIPSMPIKNWIILLMASDHKNKAYDAHSIMMKVFIMIFEALPSLKDKFQFRSNHYGPFSDEVALIINQLLATKMIKVKENDLTLLGGRGYVLTKAGEEKSEKLIHKLSPILRERISLLKTTTANMGLIGMVQFIYSNHPEYVFLPKGGEYIV